MSNNILFNQLFFNPKHVGEFSDMDNSILEVGGSATDHEHILLSLQYQNLANTKDFRITDMKFLAKGNPVVIASCDWLCEYLSNKHFTLLKCWDINILIQALDIPEVYQATLFRLKQITQALYIQLEKIHGGCKYPSS